MQQEKKKSSTVISTGVTSLITVFSVLLLSSFSLLILSNSRIDTELSQKTAQAVTDYYAADTIAEEHIAEIISVRKNPNNYTFSQLKYVLRNSGFDISTSSEYARYDGFVVTFEIEIDKSKKLVVDVGLPEDEEPLVERLKWQTVVVEDPSLTEIG